MKLSAKLSVAAAALVCAAAPSAAAAHGTASSRLTAEKQCRTELRTMGKAAFHATYGTNHDKSNAFGKCVAHRAQQNAKAEATARTNAAKTCRAQENDPKFAAAHGGKTFTQFYGTNHNGRNAFGKCVSALARAQSRTTESDQVKSEENAAKLCSGEQSSDAAAFRTKYGSGANAFGKCVSQTVKSQSGSNASGKVGSGSPQGHGHRS